MVLGVGIVQALLVLMQCNHHLRFQSPTAQDGEANMIDHWQGIRPGQKVSAR